MNENNGVSCIIISLKISIISYLINYYEDIFISKSLYEDALIPKELYENDTEEDKQFYISIECDALLMAITGNYKFDVLCNNFVDLKVTQQEYIKLSKDYNCCLTDDEKQKLFLNFLDTKDISYRNKE